MKKIILAPLAFILSLSLFACSKNTQKPDKTTDNTTLTNDTTADPNPIPVRYRITKEVYDSYFNPTFDQFYALNLTYDETSSWVGDVTEEINAEYKISKGKIYCSDETYGDTLNTFKKGEDGSIKLEEYRYYTDSWSQTNSTTVEVEELPFYAFGTAFDYSKLTFDLENNVYKSDEVVKASRYGFNNEYSNFVIKFDNNKPISLSYHMKQKLVHDGGEDARYIGDITFTFSNIGTTEVISPFDQKYIVDKDTFDSYFNITTVDDLLKLNYTLEEVEKGVYLTGISTFAINYGKYLINEYTYYEMTKQEDSNTLAHVDSYHYDKATHQITSESSFYQDMDYSINTAFGLSFFNFNDFKFNEETKAYECKEVDVKGNSIYYDIKIYFENNTIIKYTYRDVYEDSGTYYDVTKTFTNVGTTTIDISE